MGTVEQDCIAQIRAALEDYEQEVKTSALKPKSKSTYIRHARHFVRWLQNDFEPGGTLT